VTNRATASTVGVVLLVGLTVSLAAAVGAATVASLPDDGASVTATSLSLSVSGDRLTLTHRGGDALDVRTLRIRVSIDGTPLAHQPPVPFFAARGFRGGPTGPFNVASDPTWTAGESASVRLAETNHPSLAPGSRVVVRVFREGVVVAVLEAQI
jgi:hypothetical protein